MDTALLRNQPACTVDRETPPALWLVATLWLIHPTAIQTYNRSSFLKRVMPRGHGPPTHRHPLTVEGLHVLEAPSGFMSTEGRCGPKLKLFVVNVVAASVPA